MTERFPAFITGHSGAREQLARVVSRHAVPHALLFVGPQSVGKLVAARRLAGELLLASADPGSDGPAGSAPLAEQRRLLAVGNHPDMHFLRRDAERKDLSVEQVRELTGAIRLKPYFGSASVCLIDDAHELSISACNALLLTLEEPPAHAYFILVTHAPQRLPATVLSRCQTIYFGSLEGREVSDILEHLFPTLTTTDREASLELCDGSLAPLGLSPFMSPLTGTLAQEKAALEHLTGLSQENRRIRKRIDAFFAGREEAGGGGSEGRLGDALVLASELTASPDGDNPDRTWNAIHAAIRRNLLGARDRGRAARWAQLLLESIRSEKLVRERNVNGALQMSHLFLESRR